MKFTSALLVLTVVGIAAGAEFSLFGSRTTAKPKTKATATTVVKPAAVVPKATTTTAKLTATAAGKTTTVAAQVSTAAAQVSTAAGKGTNAAAQVTANIAKATNDATKACPVGKFAKQAEEKLKAASQAAKAALASAKDKLAQDAPSVAKVIGEAQNAVAFGLNTANGFVKSQLDKNPGLEAQIRKAEAQVSGAVSAGKQIIHDNAPLVQEKINSAIKVAQSELPKLKEKADDFAFKLKNTISAKLNELKQ
ncbi:Hypothetical protein NTJ_07641 [Nesidiocoris tenuis]|uniref:Uncharacterized protein n=1 Tax=Nesidiocoris tenuis TaxID=355587 RepID=A0ABN7AVB7_9HEMI|nr:Hypothetical protein NTJ_07641 [Nesidiocoris tenuis]